MPTIPRPRQKHLHMPPQPGVLITLFSFQWVGRNSVFSNSYIKDQHQHRERMAATSVFAMFSLEGQTAVVTGGTRGIGQAAALALAEAGANIILIQV